MNNFGSTLGHKTLICLLAVRYSNETKKPRTSYKHKSKTTTENSKPQGAGEHLMHLLNKQVSFDHWWSQLRPSRAMCPPEKLGKMGIVAPPSVAR